METMTVAVEMFGETRDVEFYDRPDDRRLDSCSLVVVGRFPTGAKVHASSLTLWKREQPTGKPLTGKTAAVVYGSEYVADFTLYLHNSNRGRLFGWNDTDGNTSGWMGY